jgi:alkanesulfonate monooxygenase SsuD/methylene tetrahydromethanopterin reductase-like flavin-dependent oxidoreductase (luciferase family)
MRIGISPFASSRDVALELSALAVAGGIDTLWLGEGYLATADFSGWSGGMESMTELAWLSGANPRARVGITAAVLPLRDMPWSAKQANTMHIAAGGGFVLVATPGFWRHDLESRGLDFDRRGATFDAALDDLLEALSDTKYGPGPSVDGPPPVWLAGAAATMSKSIIRGLPFQSSRAVPADLAPMATEFFDRGGVKLAHRVRVEVGDHAVSGDQIEWNAVTGSVDQVVDALGQYAEIGVSDLSVIPGQSDETSLQTVRALVADVLPQLG